MKYSIVIPTYNHCDDLLKPCLESIFRYSNIGDVELIISANGCKDNTFEYLGSLKEKFKYLGLSNNLKIAWHDSPLGYSRATNAGIKLATTDLIVLLNNDTVLLPQNKNSWLELLANPFNDSKCGVSCVVKSHSEPAGRDFAIFFCVMIHRRTFDSIGLLNEEYGVGGGEDTEFSILAENAGWTVVEALSKIWNGNLFTGDFPIYHVGEGTVHDTNLVPDYNDVFLTNSLKLAKKFNPAWYQWRLSNYWERAVFFKGDVVAAREVTRYSWAAQHIIGTRVFELGCSSGYGIQFLPEHIEYTGLDYDAKIIEVAAEQEWHSTAKFVHADINKYQLDQYDTIIAFEVIEHLDNGLEIVDLLKRHCRRLLITVPMLEPPGHWGPHHKLHMLDESYFPGFSFKYIAESGEILDEPEKRGDTEHINLMLCMWTKDQEAPVVIPKKSMDFSWMKQQDEKIYHEVITVNQYNLSEKNVKNRIVIDIGANIGAVSLLAGSLGAKHVIAVEPSNSAYAYLIENIKRSDLKNIHPIKKVISTKSGLLHKISINDNTGANSLYNVQDKFELVESQSFDDLMSQLKAFDDSMSEIEDNNILLKLDCEGAEYDIILESTKDSMNKISEIVLEIHTDLHPKYRGSEIIEHKLKELGFTRLSDPSTDQIWYWDIDAYGNKINWRKAPFINEHWKRL